MQIKELFSPPEIIAVSTLAGEIWNEYYPSIISQEQVDYMLQTFQSPRAILAQINEGYRYFSLSHEENLLGYMALKPRGRTLFLSKLYIKKDFRHKGYAKEALLFLKEMAKKENLSSISLTVNINNTLAIKAYQALGFVKTGSLVQDIGEAYLMDDYTFELHLLFTPFSHQTHVHR